MSRENYIKLSFHIVKSMERVATGINGLDRLIDGGLPKGRTYLLTGSCGTGKTLFSLEYIYNGAKQYSEPGIFVTIDATPKTIREDALAIGMDIKKLEDKGLIRIIDASVARIGIPSEEEYAMPVTGFDLDKLLLETMRATKKIGAKRVVIDSTPALGLTFQNSEDVRKAVLKINYVLSQSGATSMIISEIAEGSKALSKYGVEEYVVDGVIVLHYMEASATANRLLHIRKMRATRHSEDLHPLEISDSGIKIYKIEEFRKKH